MNERIGQLAEQAGLLGPGSRVGNSHDAAEKFAKLIVRECAKRVDYWESIQGEHADDLLKHFGVEQ